MAAAVGLMLGSVATSSSSSSSSNGSLRRRGDSKRTSVLVRCVVSGSLSSEYKTLRIQPGASEMDVKKAFRQLALQYHPDVCKGSNCGVQFHRINEAYDIVMKSFREREEEEEEEGGEQNSWCHEDDDQMRGMYDSSWDLWEEWMGWEGAGILDYTSHINPYI